MSKMKNRKSDVKRKNVENNKTFVKNRSSFHPDIKDEKAERWNTEGASGKDTSSASSKGKKKKCPNAD